MRRPGGLGEDWDEFGRRLGFPVPDIPSCSYLRNKVKAVKAQASPQKISVFALLLQYVQYLLAQSPESSQVGIARIMMGGATFASALK